MRFSFDQKKIIIVLFSACVLIIIANIILDRFYFTKHEAPLQEISGEEINKTFNSALKNFGIESNWVALVKHTKKDPETLFASYNINLPVDLPAALLVKELTNLFPDTNSVKLIVKEEKIAGKTDVNIFSGGKLKLVSAFNYKEGIKRKAGSLAFLLEDFDELNKEEDSLLLNSPEEFGLIIVPSKPALNLVKSLSEGNKEFIIILNDEIEELNYKLNTSYSEPRLKSSVRSIIGDFSKAALIMIDDKSNLFTSSAYPVIKSELEKRKIKLVKKSSFRTFSGSEIEQGLRNYLSGLKDGECGIVIISAEDYINSNDLRINFRKIGYKFINLSTSVL